MMPRESKIKISVSVYILLHPRRTRAGRAVYSLGVRMVAHEQQLPQLAGRGGGHGGDGAPAQQLVQLDGAVVVRQHEQSDQPHRLSKTRVGQFTQSAAHLTLLWFQA